MADFTFPVVPEDTKAQIRECVAIGTENETEEEVLARSQRFLQNKRELEGYIEEFTEEWYRIKYPGFPDTFYPLFVKFSEESIKSLATE